MTPLQKLIYNYIKEYQPICDHCLTQKTNKNQSQNANNECRKLEQENKIKRSVGKEYCSCCEKRYTVNYINEI